MSEELRAALRTWLDAPSGSAENEDAEDTLMDAAKAWLDESDEPAILGCGCIVGTHDNTSEAMHEAHPDVLGWEMTEDPHLRIGVGPLDEARLARAIAVAFPKPAHRGYVLPDWYEAQAREIAAAYNADSQ